MQARKNIGGISLQVKKQHVQPAVAASKEKTMAACWKKKNYQPV